MYLKPATLVWFLKVYTMPEQLTAGASTIARTQMGTFMVRKFLFMHWPVSLYPSDSRSGPAMTFSRQNVTTSRIHRTVDTYMHYGLLHLTWQTAPILGLYLKSTWYITKPTSRRSDIFPWCGGEKKVVSVHFTREQITCLCNKERCFSTVAFGEGLLLYKVRAHTHKHREKFSYP